MLETRCVVAVIAGALLAACNPDLRTYDQFPIAVDLSAGPVLVAIADGLEGAPSLASVDTLSPITVVDSFQAGVPAGTPRQRETDLVIYATVGGVGTVARSRFDGATIFDLHPCQTSSPDQACTVGSGTDPRPINAILGADVLSSRAVSFDFGAGTMTFSPDIAGSAAARGRACEAVFTSPFAGGGTLLIGGGEVSFSGSRIALGACLAYDAEALIEKDRGVDMRMILSTGIGISLMGESAYRRYRTFCQTHACPTPGAVSTLPTGQIHLPSGPLDIRIATLQDIALVSEDGDDRGPCKELHANHLMTRNVCKGDAAEAATCPCSDNKTECTTGSAVELRQSFEVAIVPDDTALLQALRTELRPELPEVDGILGANALASVSLDVDYPNSRLVARCINGDPTTCLARPEIRSSSTHETIAENCPDVQ